MSRLIDADALMATLGITGMDCDKCAWYDREWSNCKRGGDFEDACCAIENAPIIEERKTGKWVGIEEYCDHLNEEAAQKGEPTRYMPSGMYIGVYCNQCWKVNERSADYCPNCGAKMKGVEVCD